MATSYPCLNSHPTTDPLRNPPSNPRLPAQCPILLQATPQLIALALGLSPTTFPQYHDPQKENFDDLMHYPPVTSSSANCNTPSYRISPHTDWGTLTLLFQSNVGGLEVRPPHYTSLTPSPTEQWTTAPALSDHILINIGDMFEFWTAVKLKSTWHHVVPTAAEGGLDRHTFAYFLHPDKECVLVPMRGMGKEGWTPRYKGKGRTAEEHIHARIRAVHGGKKEEGGGEVEKVGGMTATALMVVEARA